MSLVLKIESELDERSATAAANRAERVYAEASKNISKSMTSHIAEGAQVSGKAVEKMADSARASYQKILKAQDELAQQERQLKQMREDGARGVEVQAEIVRRARKAEKDAVREAAAAMEEYDRATTRVGESGARAGVLLRQGLREGIGSSLSDATRQFGSLGNLAENAFSGISRSGGMAALGVAGVGLAAVTVTQQLYQLGSQWDAISDKISFRTGASDQVLSGITDSVKRVASDTAEPLEAIGEISGQVAQSMKLTGPELDAMTQRLAILQDQGNGVATRDIAKAFNVFGVDAKDQSETLDRLFNVSQQTGIPLQELVSTLTSAGRATKQFGLDAGQTAGLLATFERAGLSGDSTTKALTIALKNFSKEGKDAGPALSEAIQRIQDLSDAGRDSEAAMVAASTFGGKSYLDMLNAIKDHRLNPDELSAPFKAAGDSIPEAADKVEDFAEKWQKLKNTFASGPLGTAGSSVFDFINGQMQQSTDLLKNFNDQVDKMSKNGGFLGPGMPDPANPGALIPGGGGPGAQRDRRTGSLGPSFGSLGTHLGLGGRDLSDWPAGKPYWGNPVKDDAASRSASAQVPYGPGYGAAPRPGESSAMYGAEQSVLEAQHTRATAEAALAKVMADSTHTTNDQVKAENDLAQAKKGEIDASMRLHDTSVKAAESLNKATGQLSEFGAGIDADFGASKGLPGILENITKFVGNLALAGPMAQMNAISNANPNQGFGLMGFLGTSGAFGSQYTPQGIAAAGGGGGSSSGYSPSALGPAGLQLPAGGGLNLSTIPVAAQKYANDCIDASARIILSHSGVNMTEDQLKNVITPGGSISSLAAGLNQLNPQGKFAAMEGSGGSPQAMFNAIKASIDNGTGSVLNVAPGSSLAGHTFAPGHFIAATGYNPDGTINVSDTAGGRQYSVSQADAFQATRGRGIVAGTGVGPPPGGGGGSPGSPVPVSVTNGPEMFNGANWDAMAQKESSGNWKANTGNGYFGGLQFKQSSWDAAGGQQYAPRADLASPDQQKAAAERLLQMQGPGAWPNTFVPASPGPTAAGSPGQGFPLPWGLGGGPLSPSFAPAGPDSPFGPDVSTPMPGQIGPFGVPGGVGAAGNAIGAGRSLVDAGRSAAPAQPADPFGVAPTTGPGGGSGIGITPGGTIDTALGMAAAAFPGLGTAAQTGMKLASRTIQYAGQVAGIAADGWLQTLLPAESQKAGSSWLSRGVGALASVKPALPNLAGGKGSPSAQSGQAAGQQGQPGQQAPGGDTYNTTIQSSANTITGAAKDFEFHQSASNRGPGW